MSEPMTDAELFRVRNSLAANGESFNMGYHDTLALLARMYDLQAERDALLAANERLRADLAAFAPKSFTTTISAVDALPAAPKSRRRGMTSR